NTLFIKPFAGVNYYFSYTPSHTENGAIAKDIDSMKNNSVSVEDEKDSDIALLKKGYVTITPIMLDLSAYDKMKKVKKWLKAN
ncbi:hypothetical protein VWM73_12745, partial [Campylobacter coli]